MNRLPAVIHGPGAYRTRDGRRVTIHDVRHGSTFAAKGAIWKMFRGRLRPRGLGIWHVSGRLSPFGDRRADIVGPWSESRPLKRANQPTPFPPGGCTP